MAPQGTEQAQLGPPRDKPGVAGLHFGGHKQPWLRPSRWTRVTLNSPLKSKMRSPASGLRPPCGLRPEAGLLILDLRGELSVTLVHLEGLNHGCL